MLEQHPVPQNVTTFQFRLIGDMTLKQFGYLAGGVILAYISFHLPLPFFFTYPLTGVFALGGIGFAFIPIEERPMDVWFFSFIKSIYSPTQYIWQREAPQTTETAETTTAGAMNLPGLKQISMIVDKLMPIPTKQVTQPVTKNQTKQKVSAGPPIAPTIKQTIPVQQATPQTPRQTPSVSVSKTAAQGLSAMIKKVSLPSPSLPTQFIPKPQPAYVPAVYPTVLASAPIPSVDGKHVDTQPKQQVPQTQQQIPIQPQMQQQTQDPKLSELEKRLKEMEDQLQKEREEKKKYEQIQEQLVSALQEKQQLEQQLTQTKNQLSQQPKPPITQTVTNIAQPVAPQASSTVKVITPQVAKNVGIPTISAYPNVISGIVREKTGNLLVGILVTVKDKDDIPVRALKTNKLGQFAASTPLPNGNYILEAEDPKNQFMFDLAKVNLTGSVVPPIELIAKTQQEVDRQKLEHALFGKQQ